MGGNVFEGKTAKIKLENIDATLLAYFNELKDVFPKKSSIFNEEHFIPVGSVRKKLFSGDIDLAVSTSDLLDETMSDDSIAKWGIDISDVEKEFSILEKRARTATIDQLRIKAFLKTLAIYINPHAASLHCDQKKVTDGNLFGLYPQIDNNGKRLDVGVQIDWMVGDIDWLKFSYYSSVLPAESNVKGLHRTQLMLAAFQVANLSFSHINGIKDKDTGAVVSKDPISALNLLSSRLGVRITQLDTENYYKLHELLRGNMNPNDYELLIDIYFKILDSTRADIPDDLQTYWLDRRCILGLTGKFLPENSKLKEFT
jgi:hypothetical protein